MLLFYPAADTLDLSAAARRGLRADATDGLRLYNSLDDVASADRVIVVDATALDRSVAPEASTVDVSSVPPDALRNLDPYRSPTAVPAAGGYVACPVADDVAVLLIRKRGVWDLPKGKFNPGEDPETCALREVREEVGVEGLRLLQGLGTTQHGYVDGDAYAVKTTNWYLMRTPERDFEPDRTEGIRRVVPARWAVAHRHVGYETLRRHMDRVEPAVRTALADADSGDK